MLGLFLGQLTGLDELVDQRLILGDQNRFLLPGGNSQATGARCHVAEAVKRGQGGAAAASLGVGQRIAFSVSADSPSCMDCGSIMVRNGSCYKCLNCGSTSGCS